MVPQSKGRLRGWRGGELEKLRSSEMTSQGPVLGVEGREGLGEVRSDTEVSL